MSASLSKQKVLGFNLGALYLLFLNSFLKMFTSTLQKTVAGKFKERQNFKIEVKKKLDNFDSQMEFNPKGANAYDSFFFSIGKSTHQIKIGFDDFDTKQPWLCLQVNESDPTYIVLQTKELFSKEVLNVCAVFLLTATIEKKFQERIKRDGLLDPPK